MAEITPEAIVALAGWACGVMLVFIGWKKLPVWVTNKNAQRIGDEKDVAHIALKGLVVGILKDFKTKLLVEVRELVKQEVAGAKFPDYGVQIKAMHGQLNQRITNELKPLQTKLDAIKVPTAKEFYETMRPDLTTLIQDSGAVDIDALAKPVIERMSAVKFDLVPLVEPLTKAMQPHIQKMLNDLLTDEYRKELMKAVRGARRPAGEKAAEQEAEIVELMADAMDNPEEAERVKTLLDLFGPTLKKQGIDADEQLRLARAARTLSKQRSGAGAPSATLQQKGGRPPGVP